MPLINPNTTSWDDVRKALSYLAPSYWQTYTSTWTTASSAPAIGNGTIVAYYQTEGPVCRVSIQLTVGSTTTFGTGAWSFSLPRQHVTGVAVCGSMMANDVSGTLYSGSVLVVSGGSTITPATNAGAITGTSPVTWASPDTLTMTIEYPYRNG